MLIKEVKKAPLIKKAPDIKTTKPKVIEKVEIKPVEIKTPNKIIKSKDITNELGLASDCQAFFF